MQVSKHVHSIRVPFLERFVYTYLIYVKQTALIDSGILGSKDLILNYVRGTGRCPEDIKLMIITHSHPDHIGGALGMLESTGCKIAAHIDEKPWIEDIELQFRERPVPGFHSIVESSVKVDLVLKDGDSIDLGEGSIVKVIHTPGHSKGHICLLYEEDGVLFSGDSVPREGALPIYEDVLSLIKSIKALRDIEGLEVLLSSWDEPKYGDQIYKTMDKAVNYIQNIHGEVIRAKSALNTCDKINIARQVWRSLGFPDMALNPLFVKSVEAHLQAIDYPDLSSA